MDKSKQKQPLTNSVYISVLVSVTILVILIGGLAAKSLGSTFLLNQMVFNKKSAAQKVLASDVTAAKSVAQDYQNLGSQAILIKDALPNEDDIPGLANSLEAISSSTGSIFTTVGVSSSTISTAAAPTTATGTASTTSSSTSSAATPIALSITAVTSYANLGTFLAAIESSVRPISVKSISFAGTDAKLNVTLTATTYSQPPVNFNVTKVSVK